MDKRLAKNIRHYTHLDILKSTLRILLFLHGQALMTFTKNLFILSLYIVLNIMLKSGYPFHSNLIITRREQGLFT